jgi:hypothetical protein
MSKSKAAAVPTPGPAAPSGGGSQLTTVTHDELAGLDMDFGDDGLGQIDREDIKIAAYVLNMKGKGPDGRPLPIDAYYNTVDETQKLRVNAVFLYLHKTHLYSKWNEGEKRTDIVCRSYDRITGTMQDGTTRPCKGCPDFEWRKNAEGKRVRPCGPVYNMFAADRDASRPFVVRFRRTSLPVLKSYLQKHHIGRRIVRGVQSNYPLHVFAVELGAKLSDNGNYAIPTLTRGARLDEAEIAVWRDNAATLREQVIPLLDHVETSAAAREGDSDEGDTSFDTSKMAADEGRDFSE